MLKLEIIIPNSLFNNPAERFQVILLEEYWVSDITYIWTWEGWLYLAAVMDVHNREIVGWRLRERPTKHLVFDALLKGLRTRSPGAGLISHSDRGAQYASLEVRNVLRHWRARKRRQSLCDIGKMDRMIKRKWTKKSSKIPIKIAGQSPVGYTPAGRRHAPNESN